MQMNIGLFLLRLTVGLTLAAHGSHKLFGWLGGTSLNGSLVNPGRTRTSNPLNWEDLLQHRLTLLVSQNHHPDVILGGGPLGGH